VILVDEDTLKLVAATVPKRTWVAPVSPVPLMVTEVPPVLGPELGEIEVTAGTGAGGGVTEVNWSVATGALVPLEVVTVTSCAPAASAGEVAVILVEDDTLKFDAGTVPKRTLVAPVKFVPLMVTDVPPAVGPDVGEREVTAGNLLEPT
jgi:hypothetical protein